MGRARRLALSKRKRWNKHPVRSPRAGLPNPATDRLQMAAGLIFMQWESYAGGADGRGYFAEEPLTFNSR
jgi:hypothetical protein